MKITVNGLAIPAAVFDREMARIKQMYPQADEADAKQQVTNHLVSQALIREAATRTIADPSSTEIEAAYRNITSQFGGEEEFLKANGLTIAQVPMVKDDVTANMKVERFVAELAKYAVLPNDAKLREYHRRDKSVSVAPPEIHCAHILKRPAPGVYESMVAIRKRILAGEEFAKVATECTECTDEPGGDLGTVPKGRLVEPFEDVVFSMEPNEISPVFRTQYGYHIAKVYEIIPERALPYEECEERVKAAVMAQMRDALVKDWIEKNLKTAKVEIGE